jgi:hypothetical protein
MSHGLDWQLMGETDANLLLDLRPYIAKDGSIKYCPNALLPRLQAWVKKHDPNLKAQQEAEQRKQEEERVVRERELKKVEDRKAGIARLLEWSKTGGLEDTKSNSELIVNWLGENAKSYVSVGNIDAAIAVLRSQLTWVKEATPAVVPTLVQPAETLSDGTKRLPLGTTPSPRHSLVQLRDLDQRERAARGRVQGTFSSRF